MEQPDALLSLCCPWSPCRRVGLFKVLILSSQESERQRGLRSNRPLRIGNVPIVQLTQERDGAVPNTAQPMPDHSSVQAVLIIRDITHPKDPVFNRPVGLQPGERVVWGQGPGKGSAGNPDVAARCFPSGAPARPFDPAAPLRAGPGARLFQIRAEVAARRHPQRPALDPSVACDRLHAIWRPRVRHPDPVHEGLMEVGLIGLDEPNVPPFCSTTFWTKGGRSRPASALMTLPSSGNASRRASAAANSSPSGTARCAQTCPAVTPARVTTRRASVASRVLPRSHVPSRARSRSADSRGASARSRSPAGVVRTAYQHVARLGIRRTARKPSAGWVSRSSWRARAHSHIPRHDRSPCMAASSTMARRPKSG